MMRRRHNQQVQNEEGKDNTSLDKIIDFLLWSLIYSALYLFLGILLKEALSDLPFYHVRIGYMIILGFFLSLSSRIIYSLMNGKRIYIDSGVFFFWTFAYGSSILFFEFLLRILIKNTSSLILSNYFFGVVFVGIGTYIWIKVIQQMDFDITSERQIHAPSQIFTGIILLIFGILCWRFSKMVFIDWFGWAEGMAWAMFIGFALIIAGFLVLLAWWRNNVLQHRIGLKVGHWN